MFMVKSMKKMLRQTSVFEPEQCLDRGNYKYSFSRNFIKFWHMELVCFVFFSLGSYILFILCYCYVTIVNREM